MALTEITSKDRERYAQARGRGKARVEDPSSVVDARYDADADAIDLKFSGGGSMSIPRRIVPRARASSGLENRIDRGLASGRCALVAVA